MKTQKLLKSLRLAIVIISIVSCVKNDEYKVPPLGGEEPDVNINSTIEAIKEAWNQNFTSKGEMIYTFPVSELYLEGYVVSSDLAGNFYKKLIIQDASEKARHGIEILMNKTSLFETFEIGRKIYVKLDGLSITYDDGNANEPNDGTPGRYSIGYLIDGKIDAIPSFIHAENVMRSLEVTNIVPNVISVNNFNQDNINTMIQIQNMQFAVEDVGKTYAGERSDEFDGLRKLENCLNESSVLLQTSSFSDFKSYVIPSKGGSINAVLAKDFRANFFVLIINDPTNINFTNAERCDPIFADDFSNGIDAWTSYSVAGAQMWYVNPIGNPDNSATISGFSRSNQNNEDWLISPGIDLSEESGTSTFGFDSVKRYSGPDLEVYMCTDYTGRDPTSDGTWVLLPAVLDTNTESWSSWTYSTDLDVSSAIGGNLFIAFKYTSTTTESSTYEIDNVRVQ